MNSSKLSCVTVNETSLNVLVGESRLAPYFYQLAVHRVEEYAEDIVDKDLIGTLYLKGLELQKN